MFPELDMNSGRRFYDRWSAAVFRLCELLIGNRDTAEGAMAAAFLAYLRAEPILDFEMMPLGLLRHVVVAAQASTVEAQPTARDLKTAICRLPFDERLAFILRSVLDVEFMRIAEVTHGNERAVKESWVQAEGT